MNLKTTLLEAIKPFLLSESKFYQAWNSGELPVSALKAYANEYGAFIAMLPEAWEVQDDQETSEEEREHIELWEKFAAALETEIGLPRNARVAELIAKAKDLFADKASAQGALFAFEVQQPETSQSKLEGLRKHYSVSPQAEEYFITHSNNQHEAEKLLERLSSIDAAQQERAIASCREMSRLLREALDGIYEQECSHA
ncbi:MAG: hypothetical protein DCC75_04745 [Proteobacteria bacterium]|nr:MAG: hypothetical protein DCC75_04745 [Pseudomonadota bacterium]